MPFCWMKIIENMECQVVDMVLSICYFPDKQIRQPTCCQDHLHCEDPTIQTVSTHVIQYWDLQVDIQIYKHKQCINYLVFKTVLFTFEKIKTSFKFKLYIWECKQATKYKH